MKGGRTSAGRTEKIGRTLAALHAVQARRNVIVDEDVKRNASISGHYIETAPQRPDIETYYQPRPILGSEVVARLGHFTPPGRVQNSRNPASGARATVTMANSSGTSSRTRCTSSKPDLDSRPTRPIAGSSCFRVAQAIGSSHPTAWGQGRCRSPQSLKASRALGASPIFVVPCGPANADRSLIQSLCQQVFPAATGPCHRFLNKPTCARAVLLIAESVYGVEGDTAPLKCCMLAQQLERFMKGYYTVRVTAEVHSSSSSPTC